MKQLKALFWIAVLLGWSGCEAQSPTPSLAVLDSTAGQLLGRGQYPQALPLFEQALAIQEQTLGKQHPDYALRVNNLAGLYEIMNRYDKALALYTQLLPEQAGSNQQSAYAATLNNLAGLYDTMGQYDKALPPYEQALAIREQTLGKQHPDYGRSLRNLAGLYYHMGRYAQALPLYEQALLVMGQTVGKQDLSYTVTLNNLAILHEAMGHYEQARPLLEQVVMIDEQRVGKQHPDYAADLNNLAELFDTMGQYNRALPLLEEVLAVRGQTLGQHNPKYALSLNNLAMLYQAMGAYQKARPLIEQARQIFGEMLGKQHPNYMTCLNNLAELYDKMGEYDKALPLLNEVLLIRGQTLGKQHPDYAASLLNLAGLYETMGYYKKALPLFDQGLAIREQTLGKRHPDYINGLGNLAELYRTMGQYDKALPLLEQVVANTEQTQGKRHPDYARSLSNLAELYSAMGQDAKALPLSEQVLLLREQILGKQHPDYAISLNNLAALYRTSHQYEKALPLFEQVLRSQEQTLGHGHPDYAISLDNLAGLYQAMRQYAKARTLYEEVLTIRAQTLGRQHPAYATGLINLAGLCRIRGQYVEAKSLLEQVIRIQERTLGRQHPDYAISLGNQAELYASQGQYKQAAGRLTRSQAILKRQLLQSLPVMTEQDLNAYQTDRETSYHLTLSTALRSRLPALAAQSYTDILSRKGLKLLALRQLKELTEQSADTTIMTLRRQYRQVRQRINRAATSVEPEPAPALLAQADSINQQLLTRLPAYRQAFQNLSVNWRQVRAGLRAGEAAVEFVAFPYYDKRWRDTTFYAALVLRPDDKVPHLIRLCEQRVLQRMLARTEPIDRWINGLYQGTKGDSLYRLLWQPLATLLRGVQTVYYAPDGLVHQVALAALPTGRRQTLSQRHQLVVLSSTRLLAPADRRAELYYTRHLTAGLYGGMPYDPDSAWLARRVTPTAVGAWLVLADKTNALPWNELTTTSGQLDSIRYALRALPTAQLGVYTGNLACEEAIKNLSGQAPVLLHLATHGFFYPKNTSLADSLQRQQLAYRLPGIGDPLQRSGVVLAGANYAWLGGQLDDKFDDGVLTAYEIAGLDLSRTQLAVLSACQSARGDVQGSEGVFGLQRGFKQAGVRYLLVSLWSVSERKTNEFMTYFYNQWARGLGTRRAFQQARRAMQKQYPRQPYYWAAFTLIE